MSKFIVVEIGWEYDDTCYIHPEPEDAQNKPIKMLKSKDEAVALCKKMNVKAFCSRFIPQSFGTSKYYNAEFHEYFYDEIPKDKVEKISAILKPYGKEFTYDAWDTIGIKIPAEISDEDIEKIQSIANIYFYEAMEIVGGE